MYVKELRTFTSVRKDICMYTHMIHMDGIIAASCSFQAVQVYIKELRAFASVHKHTCMYTRMIHKDETTASYRSKHYQINNKIM